MLGSNVRFLRDAMGEDHLLTRKTVQTLSMVLHFQGDLD